MGSPQPPGYPPPGGPPPGPPGYPQQPYQPAQQYYPPQPGYGAPMQQGNGVAVAGGVIGIVSLVIAFIPFIDFLSIPGGIVAIILGVVGRGRAERMGGQSRGMATAGIVCGIIALVITVLFLVLVYSSIYFGLHGLQNFPTFTPFAT